MQQFFGKEIMRESNFFLFLISFIYPDDEIDPEEVDEDESASLGEESPSAEDRMESCSEGIQRAADQSVKEAAELWQELYLYLIGSNCEGD